ncbi:DUF4386 domain-containing protein [Candidatus Bathyarchaeota archaeon]|nr:DUF4386 domain-containing protein [Candidatus Bathyarchaeota archaeon]
MNSYRKTAIIVGVLFIIATAASLLVAVFLGSTLAASNYLTSVSANENQVIIAMIFELIAAVSALGTAVMLFPVLKKTIESLALGYVALRLIENIFYIVGALSLLIILTLGQGYVAGASNASYYQPLGTLLLALHDWSIWMGTLIFFGLGSLTLNYLLYKSKLVPRFLSVWGLIGAALVLLYGLLSLFSLTPDMLFSILTILALPIAVQEMVFAVWLIVKGFNPAAIASLSPHVE